MVKKINTFFDRSFQLGITAAPQLAATTGFAILQRIVPELLVVHAFKHERDFPGAMRCRYLKTLPNSLAERIHEALEEQLAEMLDSCVRIEVVLALNCGQFQASIRFFKKNDSRSFWIWELACDKEGSFTRSSLTSHTGGDDLNQRAA